MQTLIISFRKSFHSDNARKIHDSDNETVKSYGKHTKPRILVVDDDHGIVDAISLILEEEGYNVDTLYRGDQTFEKVDSSRPDVILLDVLMSGSDGRDICRKLKESDTTKDIPVLMISAHPTAKESALESGADEFLAKPFDTQKLLRTIRNYSDE